MAAPRLVLVSTVLDTPDPARLAAFYERLLGWRVRGDDETWVTMQSPRGGRGLAFQLEPRYVRPTWPSAPGAQQMMCHLDIAVADVDAAVAHAQECGATLAEYQPQDHVRVCLDPDGHPFCLFLETGSLDDVEPST